MRTTIDKKMNLLHLKFSNGKVVNDVLMSDEMRSERVSRLLKDTEVKNFDKFAPVCHSKDDFAHKRHEHSDCPYHRFVKK